MVFCRGLIQAFSFVEIFFQFSMSCRDTFPLSGNISAAVQELVSPSFQQPYLAIAAPGIFQMLIVNLCNNS